MVPLNDSFPLFTVSPNANSTTFWVSGNRWAVEGLTMNLGPDPSISNFGFTPSDKSTTDPLTNFIGVEFLKTGSSTWSFTFAVILGMWKLANNVISSSEVKVGPGVSGIDVLFNSNCRLPGTAVLYDAMLMSSSIVLFEIVTFAVMFNKLSALAEGSNLSLTFRVAVQLKFCEKMWKFRALIPGMWLETTEELEFIFNNGTNEQFDMFEVTIPVWLLWFEWLTMSNTIGKVITRFTNNELFFSSWQADEFSCNAPIFVPL